MGDEIAALFARWRDANNRRDAAALGDCYRDDAIVESPTWGTLVGRYSIQKGFENWFLPFLMAA